MTRTPETYASPSVTPQQCEFYSDPKKSLLILSTLQPRYLALYAFDEDHWGPYSTLVSSILILVFLSYTPPEYSFFLI